MCYNHLMEKRVSYFVSRKSVLTWLVVLLLACSVAGRIAYFCGEKGAESTTLWLALILPLAACLLYGLTVILGGKNHLYRSAIPFALMCIYFAATSSSAMENRFFGALLWVLMIVVAVIYNVVLCGKLRHNLLLLLVLLSLLGTEVYLAYHAHGLNFAAWELSRWADIAMTAAVFLTALTMAPHLDGEYHPTWGDRADGRRVRTLPPISMVSPYIMPNRTGASNQIVTAIDITNAEKYVQQKRKEGLTGFGMTHVLIAAYVRCVAMYPAMNRFLAGQKVYSRDRDIQFSMTIKKDMSVEAPDTCIKLHFDPADSIYDIYNKFDAAVEEVKNTPLNNDLDQVAKLLSFVPGVFLKFVVWILKTMDYFGLLPGFLLEVSPFHGSVYFTSMGSLGIPAIVHHLYDFGNIPAFCAFGKKYKKVEMNLSGELITKRYMDCGFTLDERTVDGFYYATVLKTFNRLIQHPERLDEAPETVLRDID